MSAGTLTLNNNSASVAGTDTTFTTELAAGDFIVVVVGGVPYTLPVLEVNSNTRLTLVSNYTGPRATGAAWSAVPRMALNMVTAALVAQSAEALRGLNYDKQNWQQVFSCTGTITVRLPDGTTFTGPSWKYLSDNMATKVDGVVPLTQGGTGSSSPFGSVAGSFCQGNDARLNSIDKKGGGTINGNATIGGWIRTVMTAPGAPADGGNYSGWNTSSGASEYINQRGEGAGGHRFTVVNKDLSLAAAFSMSANGNAYAANGSWVSATSSRKTKDQIKEIDNPREKMRRIQAATWVYKSRDMSGRFGIGVIADELYEVFPEARITVGDVELDDGSIVKDALSVQAGDSGVTVALHHATILSLMDENEAQQKEINQLKADMVALKKIVEQLAAR
jgi:hypothetical protein